MRLLLDESVPRRLGAAFPAAYEVRTVPQMGWAGTGNGELLRLAADRRFDALVTVDRGIAHEQNLNDLPVAVVIMLVVRNRLDELRPLVPQGGRCSVRQRAQARLPRFGRLLLSLACDWAGAVGSPGS